MKNIFDLAARCLHRNNVDDKLQATHEAWRLSEQGKLDFTSFSSPLPITATLFPERPQLLDPRNMPRRSLTTDQGMIAFFHALAHIEFMAIYLAWDIIYRFRFLPEQFYRDWLRVADEEALHFSLIQDHLEHFGVHYGELPAHRGLWDIAEDTADNVLARLALVPRYMEARGLDVTPPMIEKFKTLGDLQSVALLTRILHDETGHVELGSDWFKFICKQRGKDPETHYQALLLSRLKGKPRSKLNRSLRKQAGFSDAELDWLEHHFKL